MKTFRVTISGNTYDVQVEETTGGAVPAPAPVAPATPVAAVPAPSVKVEEAPPVAAAVAPVPAGGNTIKSPMPGTILDVKVAVGDTVEKNQVLVVLEAMKMENDIVAPEAGRVAAIHVGKGTAVNANAPLVSLD